VDSVTSASTRAAAPTYAAAKAVAPLVHDHFVRHAETARREGDQDVPPPADRAAIEAVIDAAFWASVRREEGRNPEISLAYVSPEQASHPLLFEKPLPLSPGALTRLAPAVERPGIHLGVWRGRNGQDALQVWGTTLTVPRLCLVVEVVAPGLLVVKHRRGESGKFRNVAVLEGDQIKVVDEAASRLPDCPALLSSLLGFAAPDSWGESVNVLVQIAVSMRQHRRGGSMLVVPGGASAWRESIVGPITYSVSPAFTGLADRIREGDADGDPALARAVDALAGLTAVDGATVITDRYELLAFGVKIGRRSGSPQVEQVLVTEPIQGTSPLVAPPGQLGGTRHLSAAQFVQDQRDSVALVASQDGRFTVFGWSACEGMAHAHRVEALLL
jgi:hypothetical protein